MNTAPANFRSDYFVSMKKDYRHNCTQYRIVCMVAILLSSCAGRRVNWRETYRANSKQPYGTFLISEMLRNYFPDKKFLQIQNSLAESLPVEREETGNYVFIGEALYLDSLDRAALLAYVRSGNIGFISSRTLPYELMDSIYTDQCQMSLWEDYQEVVDSVAGLRLKHPALRGGNVTPQVRFVRYHTPYDYYWQYIDQEYFCESTDEFFPIRPHALPRRTTNELR